MSRPLVFHVWVAMKQRCINPNNPRWKDYGGRGIRVCQRWLDSFEAFHQDMGPRPNGFTLERRDNDRGYEPSNCYWATQKQQAQNRRPLSLRHDSSTGVKGVTWESKSRKFRVHVCVNGRRRALGRFSDLFEAVCVRKSAEFHLHQTA